jgi:hypothetical protein
MPEMEGCGGSVVGMLWLLWADVEAQLGRCDGSDGGISWLSFWGDVVAQLGRCGGSVT